MMIEETLAQFVQFVQNTAPLVWRVYLVRAVTMGFVHLVIGIVIFFIGCAVFRAGRKLQKKLKAEEQGYDWGDDGREVLCLIAGVVIELLAFLITLEGIMRLVNPSYYAITFLINTAK